VAAQVVLAEHLGDVSIIHLQVNEADELLTAKVASREGQYVPGQSVGLRFDGAGTLAFSEDGRLLE
jgi:multiple sugar transport system ATP-binding protein